MKEVKLHRGSVAATCEPEVEVRAVESGSDHRRPYPGDDDSNGGEDKPVNLKDIVTKLPSYNRGVPTVCSTSRTVLFKSNNRKIYDLSLHLNSVFCF